MRSQSANFAFFQTSQKRARQTAVSCHDGIVRNAGAATLAANAVENHVHLLPAAKAQLNWPRDMAVAPDGSLFVADTNNHRTRRRIRPDDLITAQEAKLDALRTHKRGLMQQIFPAPEEGKA